MRCFTVFSRLQQSTLRHCVVCTKDVVRFPELALSCLLIGHADHNEYLTVDSASLLHCPGSGDTDDDETCWHSVDAHLCLAHGILLPPQPCVSTDEGQLSRSDVTADAVMLRLSSLFRQLSVSRLKTHSPICRSRMYALTSSHISSALGRDK